MPAPLLHRQGSVPARGSSVPGLSRFSCPSAPGWQGRGPTAALAPWGLPGMFYPQSCLPSLVQSMQSHQPALWRATSCM